MQEFLRVHGGQLPEYLHRREGHVMPGVREMLADLDEHPGVVNLLLTGNTEAGARAKLAHYGLDRFFPAGRRLLRRARRPGRDRAPRTRRSSTARRPT